MTSGRKGELVLETGLEVGKWRVREGAFRGLEFDAAVSGQGEGREEVGGGRAPFWVDWDAAGEPGGEYSAGRGGCL